MTKMKIICITKARVEALRSLYYTISHQPYYPSSLLSSSYDVERQLCQNTNRYGCPLFTFLLFFNLSQGNSHPELAAAVAER
jgi:hypothetical protein